MYRLRTVQKEIFHPGTTYSSRPVTKNFGRSGRLAYPSQKKHPLNVLRVQSRGDFSARYNLFIPACHKKFFFGRSSVLSGVIRLISEPSRTEYSGEPEMSRFLVRPKACHEKFRTVRATSLSQSEKYSPNVLRVQSGEYFSARCNLFIPVCLEISDGPGD